MSVFLSLASTSQYLPLSFRIFSVYPLRHIFCCFLFLTKLHIQTPNQSQDKSFPLTSNLSHSRFFTLCSSSCCFGGRQQDRLWHTYWHCSLSSFKDFIILSLEPSVKLSISVPPLFFISHSLSLSLSLPAPLSDSMSVVSVACNSPTPHTHIHSLLAS